jgi:hypothetical protein
MEKLDSIRKGQIWLTVFRTDDGELVITFCKSYPTTKGWKQTNFLRPDAGDVKRLLEALQEFHKMQETYKGDFFPLDFYQNVKSIGGETKWIIG